MQIRDSDLEFSCPACQAPIQSEIDNLPINFSLLSLKLSNSYLANDDAQRTAAEDSSQSDFCRIHSSKKIKFWCSDCGVSFWSKCIDVHSGHNIESIESSINRRIDKDLLFLNEQSALLTHKMNLLKESQRQIIAANSMTSEAVKNHAQGLIQKIQEEESQIWSSIDEYMASYTQDCQTVEKDLLAQIEDVERNLNDLRILKNVPTSGVKEAQDRHATIHNNLTQAVENSPQIDLNLIQYDYKPNDIPSNFLGIAKKSRMLNPFKLKSEESKTIHLADQQHAVTVMNAKSGPKALPAKMQNLNGRKRTGMNMEKQAPQNQARSNYQRRKTAFWWFKSDRDEWQPYSPGEARVLEKTYQEGATQLRLQNGRYLVNIQELTQKNVKTGKIRELAREVS